MILYFAVWFTLTEQGTGLLSRLQYPSPLYVIQTLIDMGPRLGIHVLATMARLLAGLAIGTCLGLAAGLAMMRYPLLYGLLNPQIETMRPVPPIAMIPFFILWFGLAEPGKVFLITLGSFMIIVVATIESVRNVPPIYLRAARTLGASEQQVFTTIVMPAIVPALVAPIRVAAAAAFGLTVAAEFLGAQEGLGYLIINARRSLNTGLILLSITIMGILSTLLDNLIRRAARFATEWSEREQ
jgi:ABC-type nitrate/sulfonate/bicarbonate transport system permease component